MGKIRPGIIRKFRYSLKKIFIRPIIKRTFSYRVKPMNVKGPYLVVSNHVTDYDDDLMMLAFKKYMFFAYDEEIYRTNPKKAKEYDFYRCIPVKTGSSLASEKDLIVKYLKDGNNVCIYPEWNRSIDGITGRIDPIVIDILREAECSLITHCFSCGYFIQPGWTDNLRKGPLSGEIVNVYSKYDIASFNDDFVMEIFKNDLKEDAHLRQCNSPIKYLGKNYASGIQNALWLCPKCGKFDTFQSKGNRFWCSECDCQGEFNDYGMIKTNTKYGTVADWIRWETYTFERMQDSEYNFETHEVVVYQIKENHDRKKIVKGFLRLDKDGMYVANQSFFFEDIDAMEYTNNGKSLVFTSKENYYEIYGESLAAYKYKRLYDKKRTNMKDVKDEHKI